MYFKLSTCVFQKKGVFSTLHFLSGIFSLTLSKFFTASKLTGELAAVSPSRPFDRPFSWAPNTLSKNEQFIKN